MIRKILIDARMYGLEYSGIGRYIINLINEIKNLEIEENFIILLKEKYFNRLKLPANWDKIICDYNHYTLEEQVKLPFLISNIKPDLVHFPHFNIPIFYSGKFVVTIHDMTMHSQGRNATTLPLYKYFLKRIPYKLVFKKALENSSKIIVPSNFVKGELIKNFNVNPSKVRVIYEGVSIKDTHYKNKVQKILDNYDLKEKEYFFYTGNAYPHKNLELAIKAIKVLNKSLNSNFYFAIAGLKDFFIKRLEKFAKDESCLKYVKFLGFVPDEDLSLLYKNSIAFVYPSLSEGFGLQGLEAMSLKTPLLASNIPVFKEIYRDFPYYFDPYSLDSLSFCMKKVLNISDKKKDEKIMKAKKILKGYSWRKMAQETLFVYRDALRK